MAGEEVDSLRQSETEAYQALLEHLDKLPSVSRESISCLRGEISQDLTDTADNILQPVEALNNTTGTLEDKLQPQNYSDNKYLCTRPGDIVTQSRQRFNALGREAFSMLDNFEGVLPGTTPEETSAIDKALSAMMSAKTVDELEAARKILDPVLSHADCLRYGLRRVADDVRDGVLGRMRDLHKDVWDYANFSGQQRDAQAYLYNSYQYGDTSVEERKLEALREHYLQSNYAGQKVESACRGEQSLWERFPSTRSVAEFNAYIDQLYNALIAFVDARRENLKNIQAESIPATAEVVNEGRTDAGTDELASSADVPAMAEREPSVQEAAVFISGVLGANSKPSEENVKKALELLKTKIPENPAKATLEARLRAML